MSSSDEHQKAKRAQTDDVAIGGQHTSTPSGGPPVALRRAGGGPRVSQQRYGTMPDGTEITQTILRNSNGMQVAVLNYGAIITELLVPDAAGELANVVLGLDGLDGYRGTHPYFGALIGRYANRIARGTFELDGRQFRLDINEAPNTLHGGSAGFDRFPWAASIEAGCLVLKRLSPDGEQGFPGNLRVQVRYWLTDDNILHLRCLAETDAATPVNLTQHSYFNLAGGGPIHDHQLMIAASTYTPIDAASIPLGGFAAVAGSPFDFRSARAIGSQIDDDHPQLRFGKGYDHNFVLDRGAPAVSLRDPQSGRVMELWTDQPGVQFYSGNFLDGSLGRGGRVFNYREGLCLEPQHFPNSPNIAAFPSTILRPGERYTHSSSYHFHATMPGV
jgi:aldose 1-epimerase